MPVCGVSNTEERAGQALNRGGALVSTGAGQRGQSGQWGDVFVVAGPTASGKTERAIELAERWNAEIISADACQIYRGLAMLSAQPTAVQRARVRHFLVDLLPCDRELSVVDFAEMGRAAMEEIRGRGRRILVVGGAGFYLEALFDDAPSAPAPDAALREELRNLPLGELVEKLEKLDPAAAASIDLQNPRRVQRAIEIVAATGLPFATFARRGGADVRGIVLEIPREELHRRIEWRVDAMLENGAIEEVRRLGACSQTCGKTIGVSEIRELLAGQISLAQCREKMVIATRQYAKRQGTWFRNRGPWKEVPADAAMAAFEEVGGAG